MSIPLQTWHKDPDDVLDYSVQFSRWLKGDTLASAPTWTPATGLTLNSTSFATSGLTTGWISGGASGSTYDVTVHAVTLGGRTKDVTLRFVVD